MNSQKKINEINDENVDKKENKESEQKHIDEQLEEFAQLLIDIYLNEIKNEQVINYSNGTDAGSKNSITV